MGEKTVYMYRALRTGWVGIQKRNRVACKRNIGVNKEEEKGNRKSKQRQLG